MNKRCMIFCFLGITFLLSGCAKQQQLSIADRTTRGDTNNETQNMVTQVETTESQETTVMQESEEDQNTEVAQEITYITEKLFITQINHIYYNAQDFLGKTIEYEGIFETYRFEDTNQIYYYVVRYGPGCCSNDSSAGFEITWDENTITKPEENGWVKVRGVLNEYEDGEYTYLRLNVVSLEEMETRGLEYVEN